MHLRYPPAHPLLFAVLLLFFCHHSQAESVNILDFGAKPGAATDSAPALAKALEYAKSHVGCTIVIPKGQFYIKTISDPASIQPPARFHLRASGLKKVTIQGQGAESEILFGQFAAGIMLEKCEGVTIKNLVFDYAFPLFSQGQVMGYSPANHGLTLKPDAGYPSPLNSPETIFANPGACWMTLNKKGMELAFFGALFVDKTEAEAGNVRYIIANRPGNAGEFINRFQGGSQTGALAGVRYVRVSRNAGHPSRWDESFCYPYPALKRRATLRASRWDADAALLPEYSRKWSKNSARGQHKGGCDKEKSSRPRLPICLTCLLWTDEPSMLIFRLPHFARLQPLSLASC